MRWDAGKINRRKRKVRRERYDVVAAIYKTGVIDGKIDAQV